MINFLIILCLPLLYLFIAGIIIIVRSLYRTLLFLLLIIVIEAYG